jgi:hypothetical protein
VLAAAASASAAASAAALRLRAGSSMPSLLCKVDEFKKGKKKNLMRAASKVAKSGAKVT